MPSDMFTARDPLLARADRAIADASTTRSEVRRSLIAAGQNLPYRAWPLVGDPIPAARRPWPAPPVEPWWSVARTLASADKILREADEQLERAWLGIVPAVEAARGPSRR